MGKTKSNTKKVMSTQDWLNTRSGYILKSFLLLLTSYAFSSWAIDSGSILQYFIAVFAFIASVIVLIRSFKK